MAQDGDTERLEAEAALAWALREVRLLFPRRQLTDREAAVYAAAADVWARQYADDREKTVSRLAAKLAYEQARDDVDDAFARLDAAGVEYFGHRWPDVRRDVLGSLADGTGTAVTGASSTLERSSRPLKQATGDAAAPDRLQ